MSILIYSDVHGNLPAFEKVLAENKDCTAFICLGDLVNYGPWSNECVDLAMSLPQSKILMGNHEEAFINGFYPGSNQLVQDFFNQCIAGFNRKKEISTFIAATQLGHFCLQHTIQDKYIYPDTDVQLDQDYMIGHSHHQFRYTNNGFTLYNAGSVGQNRKYINKADYLIYNTEDETVEMKSTIYDVDLIINEMKARKYSENCIQYYSTKERI